MPAWCFDFNFYKQANVNMAIRSWKHYTMSLGAIGFMRIRSKSWGKLVNIDFHSPDTWS